MNSKQRKILKAILAKPVPSSVIWNDIEKLFIALGCEVTEGRGSRVRVVKEGIFAVFHRPHPKKETNKGAIASVKDYLTKIGAIP